ncbi:MAG: hypothetical protein LUH04_06870 [Clostridium sp.]|nr:hypothetical protein [Clostridium sp.]
MLTALIEELAEESREKRKPVFLSNEVWAQAAARPTFEKFCKLLAKHFNIVLIGFVRDPLSWSYSAWNQIVRTVPFAHTFAEFLASDLRGRVQ